MRVQDLIDRLEDLAYSADDNGVDLLDVERPDGSLLIENDISIVTDEAGEATALCIGN